MKTAHDLVQAARAPTQEIAVAEAQAAIAQADLSHIDPELDKLMD